MRYIKIMALPFGSEMTAAVMPLDGTEQEFIAQATVTRMRALARDHARVLMKFRAHSCDRLRHDSRYGIVPPMF